MSFREYLEGINEASLPSNFSTEEKRALRKQLNSDFKQSFKDQVTNEFEKADFMVGSFTKPTISFHQDHAFISFTVNAKPTGDGGYKNYDVRIYQNSEGDIDKVKLEYLKSSYGTKEELLRSIGDIHKALKK